MKKIFYVLLLLVFTALPTFSTIDGSLAMEAIQAEQERDLTKLHTVAQKIILKNPEDPFGYSLEAKYFFINEEYENAIKYYTKAIDAVKTVQEQDSIKLKEWGFSDSDISRTLNYNSSLSEYYTLRGSSFAHIGKYSEAINDFTIWEKVLGEKNYHTTMKKAICLAHIERYKEALENFKIAIKIAKNQEQKNRAEEYYKQIEQITK